MEEFTSTGSLGAVNTFGPAGLLSRQVSAGAAYYAFDERGNVSQRTNSAGAVTGSDLYDGYGARQGTAAVQPDPFGYGGQWGYYTDVETGLILCTHRFYDPQAGRFVTRDPIGYAGGVNLYGYTANNPVNESDPNGTDDTDTTIFVTLTGIGIVGGGAVGAGGGGILGFGVGAIPGAVVGAGAGALAGAASAAAVIAMRHGIMYMLDHGHGGGAGIETGPSNQPKDIPTKETNNWSADFNSEGEARQFARQKLGKDPIEYEPNKFRSRNGKWQYRAKPGDLKDRHIHLEELDPLTGRVKQNVHCRWKQGAGR